MPFRRKNLEELSYPVPNTISKLHDKVLSSAHPITISLNSFRRSSSSRRSILEPLGLDD